MTILVPHPNGSSLSLCSVGFGHPWSISHGDKTNEFLVVGIDYFTKWVKAELLGKITERNVKSFVCKNIICRFKISRVLVSENGRQFDITPFREFCEQLGIRNHYSSPSHPQVNGQAKIAN